MGNQWTTTEIARMENRRYIWRDAKLLVAPLTASWSTLAISALGVGLCWRFVSAAARPDIYTLLDVCGLALWGMGWAVAGSLSRAIQRRDRFQNFQPELWSRNVFVALALLGSSLWLALALSGVLLGYGLPTVLQEISTQEIAQFNISLGGLAILALILGGALCVLGSSALALLGSRIQSKLAPLVWLLASLYFQLSAIGNLGEHIKRVTPAGNLIFSWMPPSLGSLARLEMAKLADPGIRYEYVQPLTDSIILIAVAGLLLLVLINLLLAPGGPAACSLGFHSAFFSIGSVTIAIAYLMCSEWTYVNNAAVSAPGSWRTILATGVVAYITLAWIWGSRTVKGEDLLWPLATLLTCIGLTGPQVHSVAVSHVQVLAQALVLLPLFLGAAVMLGLFTGEGAPFRRGLVVTGIAAVLLPILPAGSSFVDVVARWSLSSSSCTVVTSGIALLLLIGLYRLVAPQQAVGKVQRADLRPAA